MGKQMEKTKIGVLTQKLVFQEKCGETFREITWHKGTIVEIYECGENIYHKTKRLQYQESDKVKVYYCDEWKFTMIAKHRIDVMEVDDIRWEKILSKDA